MNMFASSYQIVKYIYFNFNHDGRLDAIERAGQMSFLEMAMGLDDMGDDDTDFELDDDNYDEW